MAGFVFLQSCFVWKCQWFFETFSNNTDKLPMRCCGVHQSPVVNQVVFAQSSVFTVCAVEYIFLSVISFCHMNSLVLCQSRFRLGNFSADIASPFFPLTTMNSFHVSLHIGESQDFLTDQTGNSHSRQKLAHILSGRSSHTCNRISESLICFDVQKFTALVKMNFYFPLQFLANHIFAEHDKYMVCKEL